MGCIGGWNCNPTTIDQWRRPLSNGTLLVGGAAPLANDGIAGWTGTDPGNFRPYLTLLSVFLGLKLWESYWRIEV
jgi:hypothetical protein